MLSSLSEALNLIEMGKYLRRVKWDKEDLEHAKKFIEQISFLSEEKFMAQDFKGLDEFEYFISNNSKILVPTIGQYSSGKSTLLNVLIGKDLLPTSDGVCTNRGVIIEYISKKDIAELYEMKLTLGSKFFTFNKGNLICKDINKIQEEIDKINKEHKEIKLEDSFLLLKVHIEFFELLKEEDREKILLIDFPGLGVLKTKNFFSSDVLGPLINQSDSFLFFNNEVINSDENQKIIINIVEKIKNRKVSFSYRNCLFIMNKWDKHKNSDKAYSLDIAKNELKSIFSNNQLEHIFPQIDMINCSARDYKAFLKKKNIIINFVDYLSCLKDNFEEEEDDEDDENKNKKFYEYIIKDILDIKNDLKSLNNQNDFDKEEYLKILNNFLEGEDYEFQDVYKNDIIDSYLCILANINNHKLMIESNKQNLDKCIKAHILSAISNLKYSIEVKGINFLRGINNTLSFILDKLNSPMKKNLKFSKIEESENRKKEIEKMFEQFKILITFVISSYRREQDTIIDSYIKDINKLFNNKKNENTNISNKIILGRIENEQLDKLKESKRKFYQKMSKDFENFVEEVKLKIKDIKYHLNIDEKNFSQLYFETAEVDANFVNNSSFFGVIKKISDFIGWTRLSEYILHKYILYDDRETIINKSKDNFRAVKERNSESIKDYLSVYEEKLKEFENNVKNEVQKMIDLSYSDFTIFKENSQNIIKIAANEFSEYIKNKYKDSNNILKNEIKDNK